jgi:hypothetical protein
LIRPENTLLNAIEVPDSFTANYGAASRRRVRLVHIHARHSAQDASPHELICQQTTLLSPVTTVAIEDSELMTNELPAATVPILG